ncbi:MAG: O-antigen ligase family protein [Hyphomicrobiaceae bacterium]|nr:O-antigen ligase family protein [Hyphomicrobiaceae bacterium]
MPVGVRPRDGALFWLGALLFSASLIFGGGAAAGFYLSDTLLQLLAIPCLLLALWRLSAGAKCNLGRSELLFCAALVAIPLLQLIPLPPSLWGILPARDLEKTALELSSNQTAWMPISMAPKATWVSLLTLLPPIAVFLATAQLTNHDRRTLSLVFLAAAVISAFAGLLQTAHLWITQSEGNPEAVGLFANRNHFAALLYSATLIAAVWAINGVFWRKDTSSKAGEMRHVLALMGGFTLLTLLIAAQMMARSRAGLGLTMLALLGALALSYADKRRTRWTSASGLIVAAVVTVIVFSLQFALMRMLNRFDVDPLADARIAIAKNTFSAIKAAFPIGTGLGSFVPVYGAFELPQDALIDRYINHAHNDVLELLMETGLAGAVLMVFAALWFLTRTRTAWWTPTTHGLEIDHGLTRAAALIIALLVVHSFVDYHLRTETMMVTVAFCAALLVKAPSDPDHHQSAENIATAMRQSARETQPQTARPIAVVRTAGTEQISWPESRSENTKTKDEEKTAQPLRAENVSSPKQKSSTGQNPSWGEAIKWPEAWRNPDSARPAADDKARPDGSAPDKSGSDDV